VGLSSRGGRPAAAVETLERRVLLSAGDLDPTFGAQGRTVTAAAPATIVAPRALAFQGSKLLVAGTADNAFLVVRYDSSGALDPSWNGTGGVETPVPAGASMVAGIVPLASGKVMLFGEGHGDLFTIRYNADGSLDPTFGDGGIDRDPTFSEGTEPATLNDVAVGPEGQIYTAGSQGDDEGIFRALDVGRLFAVGQEQPTDSIGDGGFEVATSVAVGADGRVVVGGDSKEFGAFIGRLNPDLSGVDVTFARGGADGNGWTSGLPSGANAVAILPDGKVLVGGLHGVMRLNANGTPDSFFGGSGNARSATTFAVADLAVQADGRIILAGTTGTPGPGSGNGPGIGFPDSNDGDFLLMRLNADGTVDKTFDGGGDGRVSTGFGGVEAAAAVGIAPDGKIVAVGPTITGDRFHPPFNFASDFALARYKGSTPPNDTIRVAGTGGNDTIRITQSGTTLTVNRNGTTSSFSTVGKTKLVVTGAAGNDTLSLAPGVTLQSFLYGGPGDDRLHAGGGRDDLFGGPGLDTADYADANSALKLSVDDLRNDGAASGSGANADNVHADIEIVLGGNGDDTITGSALPTLLAGNGGNDHLTGSSGRDVLIGGRGKDDLTGNGSDDLLIDAATKYDPDPGSLRPIYREWTNFAHAYAQRIAALQSGVGASAAIKLNAANIPNDFAADSLHGGLGRDWFIRHAGDLVTDVAAGETVTVL
jgi:uncharacterized delta-60 repeat protein